MKSVEQASSLCLKKTGEMPVMPGAEWLLQLQVRLDKFGPKFIARLVQMEAV